MLGPLAKGPRGSNVKKNVWWREVYPTWSGVNIHRILQRIGRMPLQNVFKLGDIVAPRPEAERECLTQARGEWWCGAEPGKVGVGIVRCYHIYPSFVIYGVAWADSFPLCSGHTCHWREENRVWSMCGGCLDPASTEQENDFVRMVLAGEISSTGEHVPKTPGEIAKEHEIGRAI